MLGIIIFVWIMLYGALSTHVTCHVVIVTLLYVVAACAVQARTHRRVNRRRSLRVYQMASVSTKCCTATVLTTALTDQMSRAATIQVNVQSSSS